VLIIIRATMHDHAHHHAEPALPGSRGRQRRLLATLLVTATIMFAEVVGGWLSGSLALLADAGHMLTDVLALVVAFAAVTLGQRPADPRRTYGYRRLEILAALANGVALVAVSGSIVYEALQRWNDPTAVDVTTMAAVAALGLGANLVSLWLLGRERSDLNMRAAFLHILGDTLSSVGVLVVAGLIAFTGWVRLDPVLSLGIALVIVVTSFTLLRDVVEVLLEAAPRGIDTEKVRKSIVTVAGVDQVHDLHVWSIASGMAALSAHVVVKDPGQDAHGVLLAIQTRLRQEYAIDHSTLQVERHGEEHCGGCD
jgi:cobalt-zinc-cadmium efflux system protein